MCVPAHGQIRGNTLKSALSFEYSPPFILGGEGWGLSLTRNLLRRLGWLAGWPASLYLLSKAGLSKVAPRPLLFYFVSSPGF